MPAVTLHTRVTPLANPFCHACFPQGGLTLGQALHVSVQVLTGLQHLHRLGVLHRDLRTSNILVEGRDPLHVLVADFGVSHVLRQLEGATGTVGYAGLRLLSAGEAVRGGGALGKLGPRAPCATMCLTLPRSAPAWPFVCCVCTARVVIGEVALCLRPVPVNTTPCVATSETSCHPAPLPCYF